MLKYFMDLRYAICDMRRETVRHKTVSHIAHRTISHLFLHHLPHHHVIFGRYPEKIDAGRDL